MDMFSLNREEGSIVLKNCLESILYNKPRDKSEEERIRGNNKNLN